MKICKYCGEYPETCKESQRSGEMVLHHIEVVEVAPPSPLRKLLKERQEAVWAGV